MRTIPMHSPALTRILVPAAEQPVCRYLKAGHCYWCCTLCDLDRHICGGCGAHTDHNGMERRYGAPTLHRCEEIG